MKICVIIESFLDAVNEQTSEDNSCIFKWFTKLLPLSIPIDSLSHLGTGHYIWNGGREKIRGAYV